MLVLFLCAFDTFTQCIQQVVAFAQLAFQMQQDDQVATQFCVRFLCAADQLCLQQPQAGAYAAHTAIHIVNSGRIDQQDAVQAGLKGVQVIRLAPGGLLHQMQGLQDAGECQRAVCVVVAHEQMVPPPRHRSPS